MKKVLIFLLIFLCGVIGYEVFVYQNLLKKEKINEQQIVQNIPLNSPTISQTASPLAPTPFPLYTDYQNWVPNTILAYQRKSEAELLLMSARVLIKTIDYENGQFTAETGDKINIIIYTNNKTKYYTVHYVKSQFPEQKEQGNFSSIKVNDVVLVEWQNTQNQAVIESATAQTIMRKI